MATATVNGMGLRSMAATAYRIAVEEGDERHRERVKRVREELARNACRVIEERLCVRLSVDDMRFDEREDGMPIRVLVEVDEIPFSIHLQDASSVPYRAGNYVIRLRVPCARGCEQLVPGPEVKDLPELGRLFAEPPASEAICDACADVDAEDV